MIALAILAICAAPTAAVSWDDIGNYTKDTWEEMIKPAQSSLNIIPGNFSIARSDVEKFQDMGNDPDLDEHTGEIFFLNDTDYGILLTVAKSGNGFGSGPAISGYSYPRNPNIVLRDGISLVFGASKHEYPQIYRHVDTGKNIVTYFIYGYNSAVSFPLNASN